jgi:large subunit ribosomal protein L23
MKPADVLIRPVITEKVNAQMETSGRYTFVVDKRSNKLEIKKAIEEFYNVKVVDIHKTRFTKSGLLTGTKSSYKKATITLAQGDSIDLFS